LQVERGMFIHSRSEEGIMEGVDQQGMCGTMRNVTRETMAMQGRLCIMGIVKVLDNDTRCVLKRMDKGWRALDNRINNDRKTLAYIPFDNEYLQGILTVYVRGDCSL